MKLYRLTLNNFQGIKSLSFDFPEGRSASIYGDNATGKTTCYNALTWLLFDKASTAAKNFTPKTKGPDGDLHHLDHSAEAVFVTDTGRQITLKKTYHESYKKKRGSAMEEFDGHTVEYGYPLISKQVSNVINEGRRNIAGSRYRKLHGEYQRREGGKKSQFDQSRYLPLSELPILISEKCCEVNKKGPSHIYQHRTGRKSIVATMAEESLLRRQAWLTTGCNAFNAREPISKPMSIWREQDILEYITRYDTEICSVYGQIEKTDGKLRCTGCQRTGCVYCSLGVHLEKGETRFQRLKKTHPSLYEYCMGGGEWQPNIKYDCTITDTRVWNPKEVWGPSNSGLGMAKIFDMINAIYGKDFIRYE